LGSAKDIDKLTLKLEKTIDKIIKTIKTDSFYELDLATPHRQTCVYRDYENSHK